MMLRLGLTLACLALLCPAAAMAQGGFVENLFRSLAESQLERLERDRGVVSPVDPRVRTNPPNTGDRGRVVPPPRIDGGSALPPIGTTVNRSPVTQNPTRGTATPTWQTLRRNLEAINAQLRQESAREPNLRRSLADIYRVSSQANSLAEASSAGREDVVQRAYAEFDQQYRSLSYAIRSSSVVSDSTRRLIRESDQLIGRLERIYSTDPQWNRQRFKDVVLISQTMLRTLLDDVDLISMSESDRRRLTHDLRLLHRRLVQVRDQVDAMTYSDVADQFNRFAADIAPIANSLRRLNHPHIDRRLDRLAEMADEVYELLWMQPPVSSGTLLETARRVEASAEQLRDTLDRSRLRQLDHSAQDRIEDLVRDIDRAGHDLVESVRRDRSGRGAVALIQRIDASLFELERFVQYLPGPHHTSLSLLRSEIDALLRLTGSASTNVINVASLLPAAATLEGASEALRDELRRIDRYLQPASFRSDVRRAGDDLYRTSRDLHEAIADRRDLDEIRRRATAMIDPWQSLTRNIPLLDRNGTRESQSRLSRQYYDAMVPAIGDVAAMLGL